MYYGLRNLYDHVLAGRTRANDGKVHSTGPRLRRYLYFNSSFCGPQFAARAARNAGVHRNMPRLRRRMREARRRALPEVRREMPGMCRRLPGLAANQSGLKVKRPASSAGLLSFTRGYIYFLVNISIMAVKTESTMLKIKAAIKPFTLKPLNK